MAARRLDADVLIVGGGPAGAAAAIACATRGLATILVEGGTGEAERPGESLHPGIEPLIRQLGCADLFPATVEARHAGVSLRWGDRPARFEPFGGDADGPWRGFQVRRRAFEAMLRQRARDAGAVLHQPCRAGTVARRPGGTWRVESAAGAVSCAIVMDATGPARWFGRALDLPVTRHSPPLVARYGYVEGRCPAREDVAALRGDRDGWTWSARVAPGLYGWVRLALRPGGASGPPGELHGLAPRGSERGADVTWRRTPAAAGPGWFLVGDAAAQLDPASSHGVLRAMMSGTMAGHLAAATLRGAAPAGTAASQYRAWLDGGYRKDAAALAALYREIGIAGFGPVDPPVPVVSPA